MEVATAEVAMAVGEVEVLAEAVRVATLVREGMAVKEGLAVGAEDTAVPVVATEVAQVVASVVV